MKPWIHGTLNPLKLYGLLLVGASKLMNLTSRAQWISLNLFSILQKLFVKLESNGSSLSTWLWFWSSSTQQPYQTCHHPSIRFTEGSMSSPCLLLAHLLITSMLLNLLGFLLPLVGLKSMWMLHYPPLMLPSLQLQGITLASPSKFGLESWR